MPSLTELVRSHTDLDADDVAWLQLIQADWQIIADLSFADLVLWLPDREGKGFWAGAQMRPTTGPTAYVDDVVGTFVPAGRRPMLDAAYEQGRLVREGDPEWRDHVPVRVETIPVRRAGRVIAVIARNTNLLGVRTPSRLELSYLQTAADLTQMIAARPLPGAGAAQRPRRLAPGRRRVRADRRRRPGHLRQPERAVGLPPARAHRATWRGWCWPTSPASWCRSGADPDEETVSAVLGGRVHRDTELGTDDVALIVRVDPAAPAGASTIGALVLLRDVTDLRRRDRELVTKDATIREIHHRVKNNLQTVAALLRLQARRIDAVEAKAALEEAVRRVGSIAIVHETLSAAADEQVGFDEIADRLGRMVTEVSATGDRVRVVRGGVVRRAVLGGRRPRWRWCSPRCCRTPSSTGTHEESTPRPDRGRASAGWWAGWR